MIKAYTLFSGSSGNCIYIKSPKTEILIDSGKSCGAIQKSLLALGSSLENIKGIFVTHEHSDHTQGLEIISKKFNIPVYMTSPSYDASVLRGSYLQRSAKSRDVVYEESIGDINIRSFPVPHDSAQNVGFVISCQNEAFGIATDIGHLTKDIADNLSVCQRVIVESNHDINMLEKGPYPRFLKDRILSKNGHLSNDMCAKFVCYLCDKGVSEFTLAHLSRENNTPKLAFDCTLKEMKECGFEGIPLKVAHPDISVCATDGKSYPIF